MNVLIAPDKFKGTLSARAAAAAIARGWRRSRPGDDLDLLPISDGGDGFGEVMSELFVAKPCRVTTVDAAHRPITATWWWEAKSKTAIVESANIVGLAMLPIGKFHPFALDTFGLGAVLRAAQRRGARQIIVGIGGSATNDGGFGLARALGWNFFGGTGMEISRWTELDKLAEVRRPRRRLAVRIVVAVDVENKLLGVRGATRVYGPQKGMRPVDFAHAERCLRRLATVVKSRHGPDLATERGAGAAGGLGFGLRAFAGARLQPGFALFAKLARLSKHLSKAELVITGEGAIDRSSAMGKGAGELARVCRALKIPRLGFAGKVTLARGSQQLFTEVHALVEITTERQAKVRAAFWLEELAARVAAGWRVS
ncbi:MAG: glycerate kinase [Pedosphaera sp.]|nr:glycerate kinase [Pedosphaera sp.]